MPCNRPADRRLPDRLFVVSEAYLHAMMKKKETEADPSSGKMLPVEALGLVMIGHGDEFGSESAYGECLWSVPHER